MAASENDLPARSAASIVPSFPTIASALARTTGIGARGTITILIAHDEVVGSNQYTPEMHGVANGLDPNARLARGWGNKSAGKPKIGRADVAATAVNHDRCCAAQVVSDARPPKVEICAPPGVHDQHLARTDRRDEAANGKLATGNSPEGICNRRDRMGGKSSTATALGDTGCDTLDRQFVERVRPRAGRYPLTASSR